MLKKVGKVKKVNTNISLEIDLKKQLKIYAVKNNTNLSEILNKVGQAYLNNDFQLIS